MNDFGVTGHLADLLNPAMRNKVVAERQEAGLGKERYGVVCGIMDPETKERCNKRICAQGLVFARMNPGTYCEHLENYGPEHENITDILKEHGLPWRPLMTKVNMKEATDKTKKRKKAKKRVKEVSLVQHRPGAQYGAGAPQPPSLFRAKDAQAWESYRQAQAEWEQSHPSVQPDADAGPASGEAR